MFVTFKPEAKNEFQAMLVAVGALISLFLFIIIIQHCKKSKSSIKRNVSRLSSNDTGLHIEQSCHRIQSGYNAFSEQSKDHSYTLFESQYAEISESLELDILNTSTLQDDDGTSRSFHQNSSMIDTYSDTMNGNFVESMTEKLKISVDSSNFYLEPIFVPQKPTRSGKVQENVYINVEQE